jgi:broad specificity phosphatase PhoE
MSGRLLLVRHGQSVSNVHKRLDTALPGADLTDEGRKQARAFAQAATSPIGLLLHSKAERAIQTAEQISDVLGVQATAVAGIHEVQVGTLENHSDDESVAAFNAVYERWLNGERDVSMPGGESANQVLDRYIPVLTGLRTAHLDRDDFTDDIVVVSHGAAIRLTATVLAGVDSSFALDHHLANTEAVILTATAGGGWDCVQWGTHTPPFLPVPVAPPAVDPAEPGTDPMG